LIILITPRVLKTVQQASEITEEFKKRLGSLESLLNSAGVAVKPAETPDKASGSGDAVKQSPARLRMPQADARGEN
jgi:hypothetical protein